MIIVPVRPPPVRVRRPIPYHGRRQPRRAV